MAVPLGSYFDIMDAPLMLRYKGVFDFDGLYKMMHAWLISKRFEFHETNYKDKVSTPFGNELEVKWTGEKKVNEFVKQKIVIEFHLWDFAEVEVIKDGRKMKMTKSRMEIKFTPSLLLDYNEKFTKGNGFEKALGRFYVDKVIYWDWQFKYAGNLESATYDLHTRVKKYLNLDSAFNAY